MMNSNSPWTNGGLVQNIPEMNAFANRPNPIDEEEEPKSKKMMIFGAIAVFLFFLLGKSKPVRRRTRRKFSRRKLKYNSPRKSRSSSTRSRRKPKFSQYRKRR